MFLRSLVFLLFFVSASAGEQKNSDTQPYFFYTPKELALVQKISSKYTISQTRLKEWDQIVDDYLDKKPHILGEKTRVAAYLYGAQRDFAFLSLHMKGKLSGSIDPISISILRLFYPFFSTKAPLVLDEYSVLLARIVFKKYKERFEIEKRKEKDFQTYTAQNWQGYPLHYGKNILNWVPWKMPLITIKTATPPTSSEVEWNNQLMMVQNAIQDLTVEQKKQVQYWGNFRVADWIDFMNAYLFTHDIPLEKVIYIRSFISMALYDALIYSFELKYTYMIKPPYLVDKRIKPTVATFHLYPSYPSEHVMVAETAVELLSHFFPQQKAEWAKLARENGEARLWAGVNYPLDIEEGRRLGRKLVKQFLLNFNNQH